MISGAYAEKKVEVFSENMDTNGSIVRTDGDVVVLYDGMYISAESATFDKEAGVIELSGNISVLKGSEYFAMGEYLMLNTKEETKQFSPFFFQEHTEELWMSARSAKSITNNFALQSGVVSSCSPQNPDWTIRFTSGSFDSEEQWMQMYNARLYAGDIPVFYLPYFAYSTDTSRRTGLLLPTVGLSNSEGFLYQQPIYIAEYDDWDLEILPQVRTERGSGLYSILRFADSPNSRGSFVLGGFKEYQSYLEEFDLKNEKHYGAEFDYIHEDFLKTWFDWDLEGSSGIYADTTYLSDVEYLNLKEDDTLNYATSSQVTSKVNLFLNQHDDYFGLYAKYFIDLNQDSNENTIQNLPILHYRRYLDTLFQDHFLYSFDYRGSNYYREGNKNAFQNELKVPLDFQFSLLDEYLTLTMSENLYASQISFYGPENTIASAGYNSGFYLQDFQSIEVNTNLVKAFDTFSHSLVFTLSYIHPGVEKENGFYKDYKEEFKTNRTNNIPCTGGPCEYDNISNVLEETSLEFTQYIFTDEVGEKLYHRLKQPLVHESGYDKYGELENELRYYFTKKFNYYNNTFYNHDRNVISKTLNTIGYNDTAFIFNLSYLYEDKLVNTKRTNVRYLTTDARYKYSKKWQYYAGYAYDVEESQTKNRFVGLNYNKRCWGIDLNFVENIRPSLDASGQAIGIKDRVMYVTLNLRPIGGVQADYKRTVRN